MNLLAQVTTGIGNAGTTNTTDVIGTITPPSGALQAGDLDATVAGIIKFIYALIVITVVLLIIWAGFLFITSKGESQNVEKARKIIMYAVIGLLITLAAYPLVDMFLKKFTGQGVPTSIEESVGGGTTP